MPRKRTYDSEVRERVIAEWMGGASPPVLSDRYDVPRSTIRAWLKGRERVVLDDALADAVERLPEAASALAQLIATKKQGERPASLSAAANELAYESFAAAVAILRLAQDPAWLAKQTAGEIAILYGVNADKLYRLLPAFSTDAGSGPGPASNA